MSKTNTKSRSQQIQAAAMRLVSLIGIDTLDAIPDHLRKAEIIRLQNDLRSQTGCAWVTARKHIARAMRIKRNPSYIPPKRGGNQRILTHTLPDGTKFLSRLSLESVKRKLTAPQEFRSPNGDTVLLTIGNDGEIIAV